MDVLKAVFRKRTSSPPARTSATWLLFGCSFAKDGQRGGLCRRRKARGSIAAWFSPTAVIGFAFNRPIAESGPLLYFSLLAASLLPGMFLPYTHCLVYNGCFLYQNHCCTIYFIATQSALDSSDFGKLLINQLLLWGDLGLLLSLLVPRK